MRALSAPGSIVGLFHAAGDITSCTLIALDLATGANSTLAASPACAGLSTNFPAFSAPGPPGALLVALTSAPTLLSIALASGAPTPLGALANNASDPLAGLAHFVAEGISVVVTQYGLWNATDAGQNELLVPLRGGDAFTEAIVFAGAWPTVYVCDQYSAAILLVDVAAKSIKRAVGLDSPLGTVRGPAGSAFLLQQKGYKLYETPLSGGAPKFVLDIPDGPGYPRVNGAGGANTWWFL